jgi:DNA-binding NarL/FixJ family response regulator
MDTIKIILVDDHTLFRKGMMFLLNTYDDIEIIAEASNGQELLDILSSQQADVVLIDIEMPVMNGIDATQKAIERYPDLKIISLSMYGEESYYYKMINAGAKGFILKNSDIDEVTTAIRTVMNGSTYFSSDVLYNVVKNITEVSEKKENLPQLSEREIEVLEHICKGLSNEEIGQILFISKRTVEKHRANLLAKTNCKNTANLVMYAIDNKLI